MAGTADQVAVDGTPTNGANPWIDSMVWGGAWSDSSGLATSGGSVTISWFAASGYDDYTGYQGAEWLISELLAVQEALSSWESVASIDFIEAEQESADVWFWNTDLVSSEGNYGWSEVPGGSWSEPLYTVFAWDDPSWSELQLGGYGFVTLIHEFGHLLGLAHPHDGGGLDDGNNFPGVSERFGDYGDYDLNQGIFTTMSYNTGWVTQFPDHSDLGYGYEATPMAFDIAAIQAIYGANTTYASDANTYRLPNANATGTYWSCIWDTGGTDLVTNEGSSIACTIDLRAATLLGENGGGYISFASGVVGGFTIANGAVLENATGGDGNDVINGNDSDNTLIGNGGDDVIYGFDGDDTLVGGDGDDYLFGGYGNDVLNDGAGTDFLDGGDGIDTFERNLSIDYADYAFTPVVDLEVGWFYALEYQENFDTLVNVENVNLTGNFNDWITGNSEDNYLSAHNGSDFLIGNSGDDTLDGGAGDDYALFNGSFSDYVISYSLLTNTFTIADTVAGRDGTDLVVGVEFFGFDNAAYPALKIQTLTLVPTLNIQDTDGVITSAEWETWAGLSGTAAPGSTVTVTSTLRTNGGIESFQTAVDQQGNWRLTPDVVGFVPPDGVYDLKVYYTDSLGNFSPLTEGQITISIASDTTAPTVSTFSPTDGATGVALGSNIVVTFSETIARGTGNIELRAGSATGTLVETFNAATSTRLTLSNNQLTIDPTSNLSNSTQYFVVMTSGTIKDSAGNNFTGTSTYDFTTALVSATAGNDTIVGTWTDDTISGLAGNDKLTGGLGNDTLDGGAGNDVLTGGEGTDTASYATATAGVTVSLAVTKSQKTVGSGNDTLSGIENLIGSAFNDVLTGSSTANRIDGGSGNDVLNGGGGIDVLDGGEGSDVYLVTLLADKTAAEITDTGTTGTDELRFAATAAGTLTLLAGDTGLETVVIGTGTGASAVVKAKTALNVDATLSANGLTITGNAGNNTLTGSGFADTLDGGAGNDVLLGGLGNDVLIGGLGQDTLAGGTGADIFKFSLITESGTTATKADVIVDFVRGVDKIDLSGLDAFLATKNVNDTFIWQGTAAFSNTTQGEVRYQTFDVAGTANDHTMIWIDNDKDTGVEMAIRLSGLHDLTASDFIL